MDRPPPPLLGFNNNVQHNGRTFHIQTEDSGLKYCRVVTHLFADGGRILQTRRTEYGGHVSEPDLIERIRQLMKSQHRSMFAALRGGEFDEMIRATFEGPTPAELAAAAEPMSQRPNLQAHDMPALSMRTLEHSEAPDARTERPEPAKRPSSRPKRNSSKPAPARRAEVNASAPPTSQEAPNSGAISAAPNAPKPRPTMTTNDSARRQPNGGSIFGDNIASEQSLDDVILSYLEDDPADSAGHH